jgi:hypothetical protein
LCAWCTSGWRLFRSEHESVPSRRGWPHLFSEVRRAPPVATLPASARRGNSASPRGDHHVALSVSKAPPPVRQVSPLARTIHLRADRLAVGGREDLSLVARAAGRSRPIGCCSGARVVARCLRTAGRARRAIPDTCSSGASGWGSPSGAGARSACDRHNRLHRAISAKAGESSSRGTSSGEPARGTNAVLCRRFATRSGGGGIRTLGHGRPGTTVFKTIALAPR